MIPLSRQRNSQKSLISMSKRKTFKPTNKISGKDKFQNILSKVKSTTLILKIKKSRPLNTYLSLILLRLLNLDSILPVKFSKYLRKTLLDG